MVFEILWKKSIKRKILYRHLSDIRRNKKKAYGVIKILSKKKQKNGNFGINTYRVHVILTAHLKMVSTSYSNSYSNSIYVVSRGLNSLGL